MPQCANPDCPRSSSISNLTMKSHWVQVEEIQIQQYNDMPPQGVALRPFAAITCSKRCAAAVLTAQLAAEDAARARDEDLFGFGKPEQQGSPDA